MLDILGSIWWLLVALGLLVTFHEFGHYWVARRCGVRVLRFSVGFGRPLLRRRARNGTEFVVSAIPLGGYVKMLDEREGPVDPEQRDQAFNNKSLGQRTAIVAAGPIANLIFAVAAFWLMFMVGIPETRPVLGPTTGVAAEAGLEEEHMIRQVNGKQVESWTHTLLALIPPALDRKPVTVTAESPDGRVSEHRLALDRLESFREEQALDGLGLSLWQPRLPPEVGQVVDDSPASRAGLAAGDRIVAIDGEPVNEWHDIIDLIGEGTAEDLTLIVARNDTELELTLQPEIREGRRIIGIQNPEPDEAAQAAMERNFTLVQYGVIAGLGAGTKETWRLTSATVGILGRMISGKASLQNLSGPITIARMAQDSARLGLSRFLFFLGLISLSLAIINLLPIPMLDGGHLMYYLVEFVKGSPVSERTQIAAQYVGLLMIVGLMSLAVFNDILRLVP